MVMALTVGVWQATEHPAHAGVVVMSTAVTADTNADGTVDQATITFSEGTDINDTGAGADGLDSLALTDSCTIAIGDYSATNTLTLILTLTGCTAGDTSITPTITYTSQGGAGNNFAISDNATSTEMVNGVNVVSDDGAAPAYLSSKTLDNDADGVVDYVKITYSEAVLDSSVAAADFEAGIVDTTAGNLTESFTSTEPSAGTETDVADDAYIYVGVASSGETISTDKTDYTLKIEQVGAVTDSVPNSLASFVLKTSTDGAAPYLISATYSDSDADGQVDRVAFAFSEVTTLTTITAADWAFSAAGDINLVGDFAAAECTGSGTLSTITCTDAGTGTVDTDANETGKQTTGGSEPTFTYTNSTNNINDTINNTPTFGPITLTDGAAPVLVTSSPASAATDVALDASLVLTFSETMTEASVTGAIARTPSFTLGAASWNAADTILTYSAHDAFAGLQSYTITLAGTIASAATTDGNLGSGPVANPFSFTTVAATSGGPSGGGGLPVSITVTAPNGGEILTGGDTYNVTWSTTGTVTDPVSLYYSTDSGINFPNTIATGETNDGSYTWTVPNTATGTAKIKVVAGSLNDVSDANFTITYSTTAVSTANSTVSVSPASVVANGTSEATVTVTVKDTGSDLLSGKVVTLTSSRGSSDTITTVTGTTGANGVATFEVKSSTAGTSTYTATAAGVVLNQTVSVVFSAPGTVPPAGETPVSLSVGDLIKSSLSTSVYYYGSDGKRHLFPNEKTYKSWYVDWSNIKTVPATQLQGLALGDNVTVRAGTVLVKIQTDPKVYAVEPGGLLRWVPTEARATTLYGSNWAQRIIDVPLVFWVDYSFGSDITTDKHPTGAVIQYTGTTDKYYVQGTEKRLISTAGFTANKFQLSNVLSAPTSITYTLGTPLTVAEDALVKIY